MSAPLNRQGRRLYEKRIRHASDVYFCPACQMKTRHERTSSKDYAGKDDLACELCGNRTIQGTNRKDI